MNRFVSTRETRWCHPRLRIFISSKVTHLWKNRSKRLFGRFFSCGGLTVGLRLNLYGGLAKEEFKNYRLFFLILLAIIHTYSSWDNGTYSKDVIDSCKIWHLMTCSMAFLMAITWLWPYFNFLTWFTNWFTKSRCTAHISMFSDEGNMMVPKESRKLFVVEKPTRGNCSRPKTLVEFHMALKGQ